MSRNNETFKSQRRPVEDVTIDHYEALADAREDAAILAERGIPSVVVGKEAGRPTVSRPDRLPPIRLQVPAGKAFAANQVLRALDPVDAEPADSEEPLEDVAFPCEECGKRIALPGDRRGKVETCPVCRQTSLVSVVRAGHTLHLCAICHGAFVEAGMVHECLGRHCSASGKEAPVTAVTALELLGYLAELLSGG